MAEEQKPAVTTEAPVVEPTPAAAETVAADKPAEAVVPAVEEPKTEPAAEAAAAPVEEKKEEKAEEKPVEPIYSGALGYKAPGLKNAFRFSKKYFWFGEDEPVSTQSLSTYLRGEKADVAHPTAAWSSVTGKGLLYFAKHGDQKETPAGVLNLADATDVTKDGTVAFYFKLHGHKHTFEAQTAPERNGWFVAVEKAVEDAKAKKDEIVASEGYKETLEKLGKPAALVATAAKEGSTPKKSTDAKPAETEAAVPAEASTAPARTGSSSSGSADEDKKKKASKSKSRSVSRGKRASIFGGFLGKKEKVEEKKEEKEEKKEEEAKKEGEETAVPAAEATTAAPVLTEEAPKPVEEAKPEEPVVPAAEPAVEEKKAEKPKPAKRGSIFGTFVEKLKSPTTEKKEADLVPTPAAKEAEAPATTEASKAEETPAVPVTDGATEAPKEETKPTTPHKEGNFFGKFLSHKEKAKTPTTEAAPKIEEPAAEEAPAVAPAEPVAEAPKEEEKKEEGVTTAVSAAPAATKKRGSIFGNIGSKKEGESSDKPKGLTGLFRNASKSIKPKKEKEAAPAPAKVEETAEPKEETPAVPAKEEEVAATPAPAAEPASIGDVVPEAVSVGQPPKSTTEVSATA